MQVQLSILVAQLSEALRTLKLTNLKFVICYLRNIFNNKKDILKNKALSFIYKRSEPLNEGINQQFKVKILQWEILAH